jgi:UDP-N-acetylglucosamine 2-epimerase (non-hydrolysing)
VAAAVIATIFGTTGELIKLAPVLTRLQEAGQPALTITTGQQALQIEPMCDDFGLRRPDLWLGRGRSGRDLERLGDLAPWGTTVARRFARHRGRLRRLLGADGRRPLVLVHGDTMTTVLGASMGRSLGVPVAHIEGGLRSGDWRNPFPEELNRRATSRIATVHFAPGAWAAGNLRADGVSGTIVDTGGNTIRDALELVPAAAAPGVPLPPEPFGLVSLHRQELLGRPRQLRAILELLEDSSARFPLLFIDHPITAAAITAGGLDGIFGPRFTRIPRQRYFRFIALLKASAFLVTDSGGSQEECAHLAHPALIHRATTERRDGLDEGIVVLSRMDLDAVRTFLVDPGRHARPPVEVPVSPTDRILEHLEREGHLDRSPALV